MANEGAWNQGWAIGSGLAQEQRARKQALTDTEFQAHLGEIQQNIGNLQTKLSSVPQGSADYLRTKDDLEQAIQSRNDLFHPAKNPGALQKFGHLIGLGKGTQAPPVAAPTIGQPMMQIPAAPVGAVTLAATPAYRPAGKGAIEPGVKTTTVQGMGGAPAGPTLPFGPAYRVQGPQTLAQLKAQAEAKQLAAAAPAYKAPLLTPEEQQEAARIAAGLEPKAAAEKPEVGKWDRIPGKVNGQATTLLYNEKTGQYRTQTGESVPRDVLDTFVPDPKATKPSTSQFNETLAAYAKAHGVAVEDLSPAAYDYITRKLALDKAIPSSTTTTTLKQNVEGQWVPVTETNYRTPGGGVKLVDPLGAPQQAPPAAGGAAVPSAGTAPSSPSQTMVTPNPKGLIGAGNIPIWNRPTVKNKDGSRSTEYSTSFSDDQGHEVLVPTIVNGKFLTPDGKKPKENSPEEKAMFQRAWQHYEQTGENLGKFDNAADADAYARILHSRGETPASLKKAATARVGQKAAVAPTSTAAAATTPKVARPARAGNTRVGAPLFAAPNKDYTETKATYQASVDRMKTMDKNLAAGLKGDQQAMLSLVANHIGMTLGGQKGARINQAVWNEAVESAHLDQRMIARSFHQEANGDYVFDGWKSGVTLTPEQMRQMVALAHEKVDVLKDHLDRLRQELNVGSQAAPQAGAGSLSDRLNKALGGK